MTDPHQSEQARPLRHVYEGHLVAGVASGIANYLDVDVAVVRVAIAALTVMGGAGIPLYGAAWLFIPEEGSNESLASELLHRARVA